MAEPKICKPRHADGRLMTEDEIERLDGRELDGMVAACIKGWSGITHHLGIASGQPEPCDSNLRYRRLLVPKYSSDIAAAFTVNRPGWAWSAKDWKWAEKPERWAIEISVTSAAGQSNLRLDVLGQPTPSDHARARCLAALLMAAHSGD